VLEFNARPARPSAPIELQKLKLKIKSWTMNFQPEQKKNSEQKADGFVCFFVSPFPFIIYQPS
jgi:hypothetical protein